MDTEMIPKHDLNGTDIRRYIEESQLLSANKKEELISKFFSNEIELNSEAKVQWYKSILADSEISNILNKIGALNKDGIVIKINTTYETGTGRINIMSSGGDRRLIIIVSIVLSILVLAVALIVTGRV